MKTRIYFTLLALALGASNVGAQQPAPTPTTKPKQTIPFKGEFVVTRTEDPVCIPLVKNLNEFRRHDFNECIPRVSKKYPQFKYPEWKEVPLDLEIAEKAFMGSSVAWQKGEAASGERWRKWLKDTETLRANGQIKMWLTEVDIDNDGVVDTIARVDRAHRALELPVADRTCPITDSGLWMVKGGSKEKQAYFNKRVGRHSDLLTDLNVGNSYTLEWIDMPFNDYGDSPPKGQTATLYVSHSSAGISGIIGPVRVCNIAWVPEGQLKKAAPTKSAVPTSTNPAITK